MSETLSLKKPNEIKAMQENRFVKFLGKVVIVNTRSPHFLRGQLVDIGKQHIRLHNAREYRSTHDGISFFCEYSDIVIEKMQIGSCGVATEEPMLPSSYQDFIDSAI